MPLYLLQTLGFVRGKKNPNPSQLDTNIWPIYMLGGIGYRMALEDHWTERWRGKEGLGLLALNSVMW
jgi:hypothetical protein